MLRVLSRGSRATAASTGGYAAGVVRPTARSGRPPSPLAGKSVQLHASSPGLWGLEPEAQAEPSWGAWGERELGLEGSGWRRGRGSPWGRLTCQSAQLPGAPPLWFAERGPVQGCPASPGLEGPQLL